MICFYHNDMDGRSAGAIVLQNADVDYRERYIEVDYMNPLPTDIINKNESVYLVDYSFKEDTLCQLQEILGKTDKVVWCDHHTSSINLLKNHPELESIPGIRMDGISGAALAYMWFNDCSFDECPEYIRLVSDYDCWKYVYGDRTTYFKLGVEIFDYDALDPIWDELELGKTSVNDIVAKGKIIKDFIDKDNKQYFSSFGYKSEIAGLPCWVINRKSNSWIFGDAINEVPVVVTVVFNGEKYSYSVYSTNSDVDCSKIAESYGGGGHKGAAGFSSDELLFRKTEN